MAEALLKQALAEGNTADCVVSSAGLGALAGYPADAQACELMLEKDIDIADHRARQLNKEMLRNADLILVMELAHKKAIEEYTPSAKGKVFRLGEWGNFDVPDPYQKDKSAFLNALALIEKGVSQWVKKL